MDLHLYIYELQNNLISKFEVKIKSDWSFPLEETLVNTLKVTCRFLGAYKIDVLHWEPIAQA